MILGGRLDLWTSGGGLSFRLVGCVPDTRTEWVAQEASRRMG